MEKKNVIAVVVTYNRLSLLKECLNSLIQQHEMLVSIVVINNHSSDGTTEYLRKYDDNKLFNIVNLDNNLGGAAGFEYGVKKAGETPFGKYVWIMDDDTIPSPSAAEKLVEAAEQLDNHFGFLCSDVRWTDGSATNVPHVDKDWPELSADGLIRVVAATFVSVLIRKESIKKLGCPLGDMQIWGDDTEYTTRLSNYARSYYVSASTVIHKTAYNLMTDSLSTIAVDRIWRFEAEFRNLIYIERKYGTKTGLFKQILSNLLQGLRSLSAHNHRLRRLKASVMGTIHGFRFRPTISFPNPQA